MAPYPATVFLGIHTNGIKRDKVEHLCSLARDLINSSPSWLYFVLNSFNDKSETVLRGQREQGMEFTTLELEFEIVKHINRSNKAFVYDAWRILLDSAIGGADKYSFNHVAVFTDDEDSGSIQIDLPSLIKQTASVLNPSLHFTFIKAGEDKVIGSKLRGNCSSEFCHAINVEDSTQGWNKAFELLRHRIMLQLDSADLQLKTKPGFSDASVPADLAEKLGTLKIDEAPSKSNTSDSDDAVLLSFNGKKKLGVAPKLGLFLPVYLTEDPDTVSDDSFFQETARPETERDRNSSTETEPMANSTLTSMKTIPGRRIVGKPIPPEILATLKPTFENSWDKPMANGRCPTFRIESSLFTLGAVEEGQSGDGETSSRPVSNVNGNILCGPSTSRTQYERVEGPPPPREGYNGNSAFQGRGAFRANETLSSDSTQQSWRTMPRYQEPQHFGIRIERIPFTTTNEEIQSIFQQWGNCTVDKSGTTSSYRWVQLNYSTLKESRAAIKFGANVHVEGSKLIIFIL